MLACICNFLSRKLIVQFIQKIEKVVADFFIKLWQRIVPHKLLTIFPYLVQTFKALLYAAELLSRRVFIYCWCSS